jgi:hypothetical protein
MTQRIFLPIRHLADVHARLRDVEEILDPCYEDLLNNFVASKKIQADRLLTVFSLLSDIRYYLMSQYAKDPYRMSVLI